VMEAFGATSRCLGRGGGQCGGSRASVDFSRELGLEVVDGWKIRVEVLARDAPRLGMATAVCDGVGEPARLLLGPATVRWSGGTAPDNQLHGSDSASTTSSVGMRRNCSARRPWCSVDWKGGERKPLERTGKVSLVPSMDAACRKMSGAWAQREGVEVADNWIPVEGISIFN
jgi:hypothetical protein